MGDQPLAYFITFSTCGTWLHGDERGSVDRDHNAYGQAFLSADEEHREYERHQTNPYWLDEPRREAALEAVRKALRRKKWTLHACHIRSNHIHLLLTATESIERVMDAVKAAISRDLNDLFPAERHRKRWTRHGSTKYIWDEAGIEDVAHYVLHEQGEPMSVFPAYSGQPLDSRKEQSEPRTQERSDGVSGLFS